MKLDALIGINQVNQYLLCSIASTKREDEGEAERGGQRQSMPTKEENKAFDWVGIFFTE